MSRNTTATAIIWNPRTLCFILHLWNFAWHMKRSWSYSFARESIINSHPIEAIKISGQSLKTLFGYKNIVRVSFWKIYFNGNVNADKFSWNFSTYPFIYLFYSVFVALCYAWQWFLTFYAIMFLCIRKCVKM